jgi:hypothetical protein
VVGLSVSIPDGAGPVDDDAMRDFWLAKHGLPLDALEVAPVSKAAGLPAYAQVCDTPVDSMTNT